MFIKDSKNMGVDPKYSGYKVLIEAISSPFIEAVTASIVLVFSGWIIIVFFEKKQISVLFLGQKTFCLQFRHFAAPRGEVWLRVTR